jgi:outer membrane protein OmpA-like peptidoglycan-associated protein
LVEHGIDSSRLESRGCGEVAPIENNKTEAGRQVNRRVEFHIVSSDAGGTAQPECQTKTP